MVESNLQKFLESFNLLYLIDNLLVNQIKKQSNKNLSTFDKHRLFALLTYQEHLSIINTKSTRINVGIDCKLDGYL